MGACPRDEAWEEVEVVSPDDRDSGQLATTLVTDDVEGGP